VVRVGTRRESCDLRSRRKPRVLHIRRMMSFVSSLRRPVALNSSYLEFQEDRPTYGDDINTRERDTAAREERAISRAIPLWRTSVCSATSTLPAKSFGWLFLKSTRVHSGLSKIRVKGSADRADRRCSRWIVVIVTLSSVASPFQL